MIFAINQILILQSQLFHFLSTLGTYTIDYIIRYGVDDYFTFQEIEFGDFSCTAPDPTTSAPVTTQVVTPSQGTCDQYEQINAQWGEGWC